MWSPREAAEAAEAEDPEPLAALPDELSAVLLTVRRPVHPLGGGPSDHPPYPGRWTCRRIFP